MVAVDERAIQHMTQEAFPVFEQTVDAEHSGIRLAGCTSFMVMSAIGFVVTNFVIPDLPLLALVLGLLIAAGTSYGLERVFRQIWPSGRQLVADNHRIAILKNGKPERSVDPTQQVNVLSWYFEVKRTARVKKGWYVIGFSLEQDGDYVPVYAFASPADFEEMPLSKTFVKLQKPDTKNKDKSKSVQSMRQAGEQRRLLTAEQDRGYYGAEVTLAQFTDYLDFLQKNYPRWMIT